MSNVLHIYGQKLWHDDAFIVGDVEALRKLATAIDEALRDTSTCGHAEVVVNNGEGYIVAVKCIEADDARLKDLAVPYTDPNAAERRSDALWPESLPYNDIGFDIRGRRTWNG